MGLLLGKPEGEAGASAPAIVIGLFVAFGGILFGYDTGTISGILGMKFFVKQFARSFNENGEPYITSQETSLIVSILSAGTFFGALSASWLADKIGRRLGLIFACVMFSLGAVFQCAAVEQDFFVAGRAIAGFGVGILSAIVPLYQSESAPKWIRGTIVGCYQWAITIGLFLASCANQGSQDRDDTGSYRIPIAIQFLWAIILAGGLLFLPETPRYLIMKNDYDGAALSLSKLRHLPADHPAVAVELDEIGRMHEYEKSIGKGTFADCFKGNMLKRLLTGCGIQALQQLTGVNFIFYFGTKFFQQSGIKNAFTIALITNLINMGATIPGLFLVEKAGRRQLLFWGAVGMCAFHFIVAIVGIAAAGKETASNVLIAFVCLFIAFFAASWGPVAWVVTGEIFPLKIRAKALSMTIATNWLFNWALAFATPYMVDDGPGNADLGSSVFFIWGGCTVACVAFVYFFIYETKGLSLEEVDELYYSVKSARKSPGWVPAENCTESMKGSKEVATHAEEGKGN